MYKKPILLITLLILLIIVHSLTGCSTLIPQDSGGTNETQTSDGDSESTESESSTTGEPIIVAPTAAPTSTPGVIDELVNSVAEGTGIDEIYLFGLTGEDWINFLISALIILLAIFIVSRIMLAVLLRVARRSENPWVEEMVKDSSSEIEALTIVYFVQFATIRLAFLSPGFKERLEQLFFVCYVFIFTLIVWKLIDVLEKWYLERAGEQRQQRGSEAVLPLTKRVLRSVLILVAIIVILDRFGINVTAMTAALGIGGLAVSLAAQDTLADMISGLIILVDQPFRVGDRIEIQSIDTWGDVVDIGTRTTRIRTRDNRMVIVPNSVIGKSEIINYTYPDPRYRVQVDIGIAYKSNIENVRQIIIDAVSEVEGVLLDKPIDALFLEFGDTSLIIRVRWWIHSYIDTRQMFDKVNTNLLKALTEAGVDMPFTTYDVNVRYVDGRKEETSHDNE